MARLILEVAENAAELSQMSDIVIHAFTPLRTGLSPHRRGPMGDPPGGKRR
jgi:hypothetical protein